MEYFDIGFWIMVVALVGGLAAGLFISFLTRRKR